MKENTWIVVADAAEAKVYHFVDKENPMVIVDDGMLSHVNKPSRDLVTTERGRVFSSFGRGRSAMERPTDPHEHEKEVFASRLTDYLDEHGSDFRHLVLTAPPRMLGYLREKMSKKCRKKLDVELAKDITNISMHDLPGYLSRYMRIDPHTRVESRI